MSNKGDKNRRIIETALMEQEEEFRRQEEELISFFADIENDLLSYQMNGQPIDDSDSCLSDDDWGEIALARFCTELTDEYLETQEEED